MHLNKRRRLEREENNTEFEKQTINRYMELLKRSDAQGIYTYTEFHSPHGAALAYRIAREPVLKLWGGMEHAQRVVIRFGNPEELLYEEEFPIKLLRVSPLQKKFSDDLTHRDFLGSVIGLGLERAKIGDIMVRENEAYIFVAESISDYVSENLTKVKHTSVRVEECAEVPEEIAPRTAAENLIVSSNILDAVIAKVYNLSRDTAVKCISEGRVFINGREMTGNAKSLKNGDIVTVRGKGKFIFDGEAGTTRKDKLYVNIKRYV